MEIDDDEPLSRIISELESLPPSSSTPLSSPSLIALQSLADSGDLPLLWDHLSSRSIPPASLLIPISSAMDSSPPRHSLLASKSFLSLLLDPSSPLYSLFTPLSLLSLLRSLRLSLKTPAPSSSPSPRPAKPPRKRKNAAAAGGTSTGRSPDPPALDLLPGVLELLDKVLRRVRLDGSHDGLKSLVETIAAILNSAASGRVPDLCFRILYALVSMPEHGEQQASAVEVLRALAPSILASAKSPKRAAALAFVTRRMVPLGRENDGVRTALAYLPRFLAVKAPERSEPRACAVDVILEIVRGLEDGDRDRGGFVDYVVKMGQGKLQMRLLAVDLVLVMLTALLDPLWYSLWDEEREWGGEGEW